MIRSRVFVFLAIALFLAGCPCAEAAGGENSKEKAEEKVTELQELTAGVLGTAKKKLNDAEGLKLTVESQKTKADNAELAVRTAATAIKEKERKAQADAVAGKATQELENCVQLYNAAKEKADQASGTLNGFVARARDLDNKAKNEILAVSVEQDDYTNVIENAATAKSDTETLSGQISALKVLSEAEIALSALKQGSKKVQVLKYQAESLVIVSNIEAKMSEAETDIQSIQRKKKEIDAIVTGMNKKLKSASGTSTSVLSSLCSTAEGQLRAAKKKVTEANECKQTMLGQKPELDQDLKTLMDRTDDETNAGQEAGKVKWNANDIDAKIKKIKAALGAADNSLRSAKGVQQQMQDELSKTSEQPVDANLDKTKQKKSAQLTDQQTQNPKDDQSELLSNDKLRNITKDITNNPLIGGEVPTRSAANDSAVTVFIPLLVILVISAVLH